MLELAPVRSLLKCSTALVCQVPNCSWHPVMVTINYVRLDL